MAARARRLTRRGLLAGGIGGACALLGACGGGSGPQRTPARETVRPTPAPGAGDVERVHYGSGPSQYADLRMPPGAPAGTVVLLHGGYWLPAYGADLMTALAQRFTELGRATFNVEYRRTSQGGGFPTTLEDVAAAVDVLAEPAYRRRGLDGPVVLLGHSAGGHLAVWAASRSSRTPGGAPATIPAAAVSLAGVLDLTRAASAPGSRGPVRALMGGPPSRRAPAYALADPALLVPARCPVFAVHPRDDSVVPAVQAASYVRSARGAHGTAEVVEVAGDHFTVIDPDHSSFERTRALVDDALGSPPSGTK